MSGFLIWNRSKRLFAALALKAVRIEAPQSGWRVGVLAMRSRLVSVEASVGACSFHASRGLAFAGLGVAGMFAGAFTDGITAKWAEDRMFVAPSGSAAISAGQCDGPTLNGSLAGAVAFRVDGHIAAGLFGWHGLMLLLIRNRGKRSPAALACSRRYDLHSQFG